MCALCALCVEGEEDKSAGWTVVFYAQIAFTLVGWAQFLRFYPSEGGALI